MRELVKIFERFLNNAVKLLWTNNIFYAFIVKIKLTIL